MKFYFACLFLFALSSSFGQGNYGISNFSIVIKGTSNLHDWESKVNEVRASGSMKVENGGLTGIQSLQVEIPVRTIKSSKGSIMDNKTYDALNADNSPNITYKMEKTTGIVRNGTDCAVHTSGFLTIAGTSNRVDLSAQGKVNANGTVTFNGSKKLKMTEFKIKPPTALMGTLKTGDEVEIVYQVTLKPI